VCEGTVALGLVRKQAETTMAASQFDETSSQRKLQAKNTMTYEAP
jgi:hypothetical protein